MDQPQGQDQLQVQGRCMKCKEDRPMKDAKVVEIEGKGGSKRRAATGTCPTCSTKMFKFLPKA